VLPVSPAKGTKTAPKPAACTDAEARTCLNGVMSLNTVRGQALLPSPACRYSAIAKLLRDL